MSYYIGFRHGWVRLFGRMVCWQDSKLYPSGVALGILLLIAAVCLALVISMNTFVSYAVMGIVILGAIAILGITLSER